MSRVTSKAAASIPLREAAWSVRRISIKGVIHDCYTLLKKPSGWKRAARVNCLILITIDLLLIILLIISINASSLSKAFMFFEGTCDDGSVSKLNVLLHLLLNVISTIVFASSNFFMQVLNSPTRAELDLVHSRGLYLDIGVPSLINAFRLGRTKFYTWLLLFVSSVPLHLLFNSIIFQADHRITDFHLTIASRGFVDGEAFYPPGRGGVLNFSDAADLSNAMNANITEAASQGAKWANISYVDCYNQYFACDGIMPYTDVIIIVNQTEGWTLEDVWTLLPNQTAFWSTKGIPAEASNSLRFASHCTVRGNFVDNLYFKCYGNCRSSMSSFSNSFQNHKRMSHDQRWTMDFLDDFREVPKDDLYSPYRYLVDNETRLNLNHPSDDAGLFEISYCLAKLAGRLCHVGLSSSLLLVVTLSVIMKTLIAIAITHKLSGSGNTPLTTLGDVIASFIEHPDHNTLNMSTLSDSEVRHAMKSFKPALPGPQKWTRRVQRRWNVLPIGTLTMSYLLFASGIITMTYFYNDGKRRATIPNSFIESDQNPFIQSRRWSFLTAILLANTPQLMLSMCYLAYNGLYTRLQMAKEWSQFGCGYHPLRVTDPQGRQYATYRLQLPYKYSIPLITSGIIMHWILSNTVYVYVSEGGYFTITSEGSSDPSLPENTAVFIGYSLTALLTMIIASCTIITLPVIFGRQKLPEGIVHVGTNSLAISAACHVSPLSGARDSSSARPVVLPWPRVEELSLSYESIGSGTNDEIAANTPDNQETRLMQGAEGIELESLIAETRQQTESPMEEDAQASATREERLIRVSQSELRWGVVKMPPAFYNLFDSDVPYEHLGFGVQEDMVSPPVHSKFYA